MIRHARSDELEKLREIERAAGVRFRDLGMDVVADHEPPAAETLAVRQRAGRAWVFADPDDEPVAYLLIDVVDTQAHIEQVSVHPTVARQGRGAMLIETAAGWAREHDLGSLTLTTFADVPWNCPYYERLGFQTVDDEHLSPGLRRVRRREIAAGLDRWPRVAMRRPVSRRPLTPSS